MTAVVDKQGMTVLSFAIFKEKEVAAKMLLEHVKIIERNNNGGIDIDNDSASNQRISPRSNSPMQAHTLSDWINIRNKKQFGMTAIHYASFNGDMLLLRELIRLGGNIQEVNETGMSALHFAAQGN